MKSKIFFIAFLVAGSLLSLPTEMAFAASEKLQTKIIPTSVIPERREFPVNTAVSPCQDFYKYTCSKAIEAFKLRDDRSRHIFSFSDSSERLLDHKKSYLKALPSQKEKTSGEQELSDVYQACMDTKQRALDEKDHVKQIIEEVQALETREAFQKYVGSKVGTSDYTFLDFGGLSNQQKPEWEDLYIVADVRGLPERSYYSDKKVVKAYKGLVSDFFKTVGLDKPKTRASQVFSFEKEFDKTHPTPKEWRVIWTKPSKITKEELMTKFKEFQLEDFLKKIPNKTHIRDFTPENFEFLRSALAEKKLEALKSVYIYHALSGVMDEGYPDFYQKKFKFRQKHLGGSKKRSALGERCTNMVKKKFMKELDYELYPKIFGDFSKSKFVKLVKKVRASLIVGIKENTWLSKEGKKNAIKKMKKAFLQVVKPNNKKEWDFNYKADYSPKNHIKNMKLWSNMANKKALDSLKKKQNNKKWGWGPLIVNAYYSPTENKFVMPVGILQYPFYDQDMPDHVNLGAVGAVVGHELGHGIDDSGSKFDYKGRLRQWMSQKDLFEFKKRGDRLVSQFNKIGHDGKLTLGENIGDLVGVTAAYRAAFPKNNGTKKKVKEFFTQYGRAWCGTMRPGERKRLLKVDSHSAVEARVNEQVKHQKGFADAFNCKPGDKMYLSEKERVRIW